LTPPALDGTDCGSGAIELTRWSCAKERRFGLVFLCFCFDLGVTPWFQTVRRNIWGRSLGLDPPGVSRLSPTSFRKFSYFRRDLSAFAACLALSFHPPLSPVVPQSHPGPPSLPDGRSPFALLVLVPRAPLSAHIASPIHTTCSSRSIAYAPFFCSPSGNPHAGGMVRPLQSPRRFTFAGLSVRLTSPGISSSFSLAFG